MFVDQRTGDVYKEGDEYHHPVLGATLRRIAEHGVEEFYSGQTGRELIKDLRDGGGVMTQSDLEDYRVSWEDPVRAELSNTDLPPTY